MWAAAGISYELRGNRSGYGAQSQYYTSIVVRETRVVELEIFVKQDSKSTEFCIVKNVLSNGGMV